MHDLVRRITRLQDRLQADPILHGEFNRQYRPLYDAYNAAAERKTRILGQIDAAVRAFEQRLAPRTPPPPGPVREREAVPAADALAARIDELSGLLDPILRRQFRAELSALSPSSADGTDSRVAVIGKYRSMQEGLVRLVPRISALLRDLRGSAQEEFRSRYAPLYRDYAQGRLSPRTMADLEDIVRLYETDATRPAPAAAVRAEPRPSRPVRAEPPARRDPEAARADDPRRAALRFLLDGLDLGHDAETATVTILRRSPDGGSVTLSERRLGLTETVDLSGLDPRADVASLAGRIREAASGLQRRADETLRILRRSEAEEGGETSVDARTHARDVAFFREGGIPPGVRLSPYRLRETRPEVYEKKLRFAREMREILGQKEYDVTFTERTTPMKLRVQDRATGTAVTFWIYHTETNELLCSVQDKRLAGADPPTESAVEDLYAIVPEMPRGIENTWTPRMLAQAAERVLRERTGDGRSAFRYRVAKENERLRGTPGGERTLHGEGAHRAEKLRLLEERKVKYLADLRAGLPGFSVEAATDAGGQLTLTCAKGGFSLSVTLAFDAIRGFTMRVVRWGGSGRVLWPESMHRTGAAASSAVADPDVPWPDALDLGEPAAAGPLAAAIRQAFTRKEGKRTA